MFICVPPTYQAPLETKQQIKVCDVKEFQIYMVQTSNKQINKCTYNIVGNDKCYEVLKQEFCDKDLVLTKFLV